MHAAELCKYVLQFKRLQLHTAINVVLVLRSQYNAHCLSSPVLNEEIQCNLVNVSKARWDGCTVYETVPLVYATCNRDCEITHTMNSVTDRPQ